MKRIIHSIGLFIICVIYAFGQTPQKFNYQAVVRDDAGNIVSDQAVGIKISLLQGSVDGTVVYSETHSPTTNAYGLVTLEIGGGTTSDDFIAIDWGGNIYFMKVEMDATGGTTYTEMGTSHVLSVPYALHSKSAENVFSGDYYDLSNVPTNVSNFTNDAGFISSYTETDPVFGAHISSGILSSDITNWNSAYVWGDHSGVGYLTSYTETDPIFSNHFSITSPTDNQLLKYNSGTGKWANWTPTFLTTEADSDITNEIQDLDLAGNILTITNNTTPTSIDLSPFLDNTNYWTQSGDDIYNLGNVGIGTTSPQGKLEVQGDGLEVPDEPLFEVKRNDGQTVFAVYPEGVRIYVEETTAKGTKGGFAVGGFSPVKGVTNEFLRVTPDSVRVYVNDDGLKGTKGGFAVGGFSPVKGITNEYLRVSPDSVRVYVEGEAVKGTKGGFAVGGISPFKGIDEEYLRVTPDSVRIYINDNPGAKGTKGGFAVGGYSPVKGLTGDYMNVSGKSSAEIIDPSEPRVLWYPNKEAFLSGRVLIESPDSVGTNSMATGFESKAIGDYSQALGHKTRATGNNSTAIGNNANAAGDESYAIGNYAETKSQGAYAIGSGASATGLRSFAIGSTGVDSAGIATSPTMAISDYAYAFGMGSIANGQGAFALGTRNIASGDYSLAMGYNTKANYWYSTAMGYETTASYYASTAMGNKTTASGGFSTAIGSYTTASGQYSTATGIGSTASGGSSTAMGGSTTASGLYSTATGSYTRALGDRSTAMGNRTTAEGDRSTAMGNYTTAKSYSSFVIGSFNDTPTTSSPDSWEETDPLFIIGNGIAWNNHNAVMVKKNGEIYFPDAYADAVALPYRDLYIDFFGKIGFLSSSCRYKNKINFMEDVSWLYQLRPVNFFYSSDKNEIKQYGLIAEEVEDVNPLFVSYNEKGEVETVLYSQLVTPMLKAIQEQEKRILKQQKQIENQQQKIDELTDLVNKILQE